MSWFYRPYVSAAERRARGEREIKNLQKKGLVVKPLGPLSHRMKIATSFWGRAWCRHLESLSDYENRIPRGRTYLRNGSVLHLDVGRGKIFALVQGSELYQISVCVDPLAAKAWATLRRRCRGGIGSLIELLQGRISDEIMTVVTDPGHGFFPTARQIHFKCTCPDWADLCKHSAAVLYAVGAQLDHQPDLLFKLRGVDHQELLASDPNLGALGRSGSGTRRRLSSRDVSAIFGEDFAEDPVPPVSATRTSRKKKPIRRGKPASRGQARAKAPKRRSKAS